MLIDLPPTAIGQLAEDVATIAEDGGPAEVRRFAVDCVLDTLGVAIGGAHEPAVQAALSLAESADGPCSIVGGGRVASAEHAALVNGTAAHALDFDDTHAGFRGHPTAPVLAAVLALAQAQPERPTGAALVTALLAGVEAECLLGEWIGAAAYERGWHVTATLGALGAAAGCAVVLGLDRERTEHALGLAAVQAGGLQAAFGTMAKPLQVGMAARAGVTAATLAAHGATGPREALEGARGLAVAAAGVRGMPPRHEGRWRVLDDVFKFHASCFFTHASIEATRAVLEAEGLEVSAVSSVRVLVSAPAADVCDRPAAASGLDSKFSLQSNVARVLLGVDTSDPRSFSDAASTDARLRDVAGRVVVGVDASIARHAAAVTIETGDGTSFFAEADAEVGDRDAERRRRRLVAKFRRLAEGRARPQVLELGLGLEDLEDVGELARALEGDRTPTGRSST